MPNKRITPAEIAAALARVEPMLTDEHLSVLFDPAYHGPEIERFIEGSQIVRQSTPKFFAEYDFDWAFEPRSWRRNHDVNLQMRALQQLTMLWRKGASRHLYRFDPVLTFSSPDPSLTAPTPQYLPQKEGLNLIAFGYSFSETLTLLFGGFREATGGSFGEHAWAYFTRDERAKDAAPPPMFKEALLRLITAQAFDVYVPTENVCDAVRAKSAWFADAAPLSPEARLDPVVDQLQTSALEFLLAHELGHHIIGHTGKHLTSEELLAVELAADKAALDLFCESWLWRDEYFTNCPLSEIGRIGLGPLAAYAYLQWVSVLHHAVRERLETAQMAAGHLFSATSLRNTAEMTSQRWKQAMFLYEQLRTLMPEENATSSADDIPILARLAASIADFSIRIGHWVAEIPDTALRVAADEIAARTSQRF